MTNRLLLCTDMDRTIIPNGRQPENPDARVQFRQLCGLPSVCLAYVTGRHLKLVIEAIADYNLPEPDYAITDVGTKIYRQIQNEWYEMVSWQEQIAIDWHGKTHLQLQQTLDSLPELTLQERSKQNDFKLSYYLPLQAKRDRENIVTEVELRLSQLGVDVSLIWSVDEVKQLGLLDILPRNATKLHSVKYLQQHLGYTTEEILFAGDSGNDLPVLGSSIRSILVANAEPEIQQQAVQLAVQNGNAETLYHAQQQGFPLGGNYSAGVLQGVMFFFPEIGEKLRKP